MSDVNEYVKDAAKRAAAPAEPKPQKKLLFHAKREDGRVVVVDLVKRFDRAYEHLGKVTGRAMKELLLPRLAALEADNKSLTDLVGELEAKVAAMEKRT
jgi:polyhydroxyalkanoate synthesis regulator phasin